MSFTPYEIDFRARRSHIACLLKLARVDNRMHINEDKMIREVARRLKIDEEEFEEIRAHTDDYETFIPTTEEERIMHLYHYIFLMQIDGKIKPEEEELVHQIGLRLGANPEMTRELVKAMKVFLDKPLPPNTLRNIVKRYMN